VQPGQALNNRNQRATQQSQNIASKHQQQIAETYRNSPPKKIGGSKLSQDGAGVSTKSQSKLNLLTFEEFKATHHKKALSLIN
jgi:hypothetical protein